MTRFQYSLISSFVLGALLGSPLVVAAETVVRTSDEVSVAEDEVVEGDFYSAGNIINISGSITEDALISGWQININGSIGADALLVGGQVDVHAPIAEDARIMAGTAVVAEPVEGDLVVFSDSVRVLSSASVGGDVFLLGREATVEGSVGGDIFGRLETLRVDGPVAGDVDVTVRELELGDRSDVTGSVRYVSENLAVQAQNANIGGDLTRTDPVIPDPSVSLRGLLIPLLVLLFSALVWYLLSRRTLSRVSTRVVTPSVRPFAFGMVALVLGPVAIAITLASMIGFLVGLAALFGLALVFVLGVIAAPVAVGQLLMRLFNQPTDHVSIITIVVGTVGTSLLLFIPFVGQVVLLGTVILSVGAILDLVVHARGAPQK